MRKWAITRLGLPVMPYGKSYVTTQIPRKIQEISWLVFRKEKRCNQEDAGLSNRPSITIQKIKTKVKWLNKL